MGVDLKAYTIFADDVRFEQSGKVIIIGAYGGELLFQQPPPSNQHQLMTLIKVLGQPSSKCTAPEVKFTINGNELFAATPPDDYAQIFERQKHYLSVGIAPVVEYFEEENSIEIAQLIVPLVIPPLEGDALLSVRLVFGSESTMVGALLIRFAAQGLRAIND